MQLEIIMNEVPIIKGALVLAALLFSGDKYDICAESEDGQE